MKNKILFFLFCFLLSSCTLNPQSVNLNPSISFSKKNLGDSSEVFLKVIDKRSDTEIGRRGNGIVKFAPINLSQDITDVLEKEIKQALKEMNFRHSLNDNNKKLEVFVNALNYEAVAGFWSMGAKVDTLLEARVIDNNSYKELYSSLYRGNTERRYYFLVPDAKENESNINESFQMALQKLIGDSNLFEALKKTESLQE